MNTPSNVTPNSPLDAQPQSPASAPHVITPLQRLVWSVRRELWEYRAIYIAPLAASSLFLLGFLISLLHLPARTRAATPLDPDHLHQMIQQPYNFAALLVMGSTFLVAIFYCVESLHAERRDRSILFWKSLPVSDLTTVLSKAAIPIVVIPVLTVALTVATHIIMLLLNVMAVLASGGNVAALWSHLGIFHLWRMLSFHLLAGHGLWYAPLYAWLLLVSAWARRAPFLWVIVPPFAIGIVEKITFGTSHFVHLLLYRFSGGSTGPASDPNTMPMASPTLHNLAEFFSDPGLWLGLLAAAAILYAAARVRRYREPI